MFKFALAALLAAAAPRDPKCKDLAPTITKERAQQVRESVMAELRQIPGLFAGLAFCDPATGEVVMGSGVAGVWCIALRVPHERSIEAVRTALGSLPARRDGIWVNVRFAGQPQR